MSEDKNLFKAKELLQKYKEGTCTEEEKAWVEDWYLQLNDRATDLSDEQLAEDLKELHERQSGITTTKRRLPFIYIPAAAILLLALGLIWFRYGNKPDLNTNQQVQTAYRVPPGTNKATLTLSNGTKIALSNTGSKVIGKQGNSSLQTSNGQLIYHLTNKGGGATTIAATNTIATPQGGQYQLILPDGTHVWLNAASSLQYPALFTGNTRTVTLTGEAYFEVSHNPDMPFIVKSAGQEIKVLGTHFNVNAYADEPATVTTLLQGSVKLSSAKGMALLKPGQQSQAAASGFIVSSGDTKLATAWKDGQFKFHKTAIKNVLRQVSRWYDIQVEYQGTAPDITISGGISRQEDLSGMLKILRLSEVHFVQQGRKLIINP